MRVDLIEQGGRGGVFQHTVEVARELRAAGHQVVIHTASDHELLDISDVHFCECVRWFRSTRPRPLRVLLLVVFYLAVTVPHLARSSRNGVAHVQGLFGSGLYAPTIWALGHAANLTVFSPHNTFARSGRRVDEAVLRWSVRRADRVVCFSAPDLARLRAMGTVEPTRMPLIQFLPQPTDGQVATWRQAVRGTTDAPVVLLPGQIRPDKGVADLIEAAALLDVRARFVVAGEDAGYADSARELADASDVDISLLVEYFELADFVAVLMAADVVVAPYRQASSSGVLSLANQLNIPSAAYPVGGLIDAATVLADECSPLALARAIRTALESATPAGESSTLGSRWMDDIYQPPKTRREGAW